MSRPGPWLAVNLLSIALCLAAPAPAREVEYERTLGLPIAGDAIGFPQCVTADVHADELFVCDSRKNRILIFGDAASFRYQIEGGTTLSSPLDVATDRQGYLYAVAHHDGRRQIVHLDFDGLFLEAVSPVGLPRDFQEPLISSIAVSPAGDRLYLVDEANLALLLTRADGSVVRVVDLVEGLTEDERINVILGKVDVYGQRVLVAVPSDGEIRMFDLSGELVKKVGTKGTASCQLGFPTAAALDDAGNLLVIDQQRMVLMRWNVETNRCLGDYYGLGGAPGYFYFPFDVALDAAGRVYVAQGYQGRVQMYQGPAAAAPAFPETIDDGLDALDEVAEAPSAAEESAVADAESVDLDEVEAALVSWAQALTQRNFENFVAAYADDYSGGGTKARRKREKERRLRFDGLRSGVFVIDGLRLEPLRDGIARAIFDLVRELDGVESDRRATTLLFRRDPAGWRIIEERGAFP